MRHDRPTFSCAESPLEYGISVRELAEFVHRRGDLGSDSTFRRSNRALEGIKGHKRIQQSLGSDYRAEIPVKRSFVKGEVGLRVKWHLERKLIAIE
jgi:DNA excision repair protein ERCC-2